MAHVHDTAVELLYQRETRQHETQASRFFKREAHIFDEMFNEESWLEVSLKNTLSEVVQGPAGSGSPANGVQHPVQIESCLVAIEHTLADPDHRACDHDLVAEFGLLPGTRPSLMHELFAQDLEERHHSLHCSAVASHHNREGGVACAYIAPRYRRIDRQESPRLRPIGNLSAKHGVRRRHIDEYGIRLCTSENSSLIEINGTHVLRKSYHRKEDVRFSRNRTRTSCPHRAEIK